MHNATETAVMKAPYTVCLPNLWWHDDWKVRSSDPKPELDTVHR